MPYLSASAVVIHYEEALYQMYAALHLPYLSVLNLGSMYATDRQTDTRQTVSPLDVPAYGGRRRFCIDLRSVALELIPLFGPWSRRGLNPIKPVYDPDRPDGRLNLTARAFNQLGQYTSSPGRRGYCIRRTRRFLP